MSYFADLTPHTCAPSDGRHLVNVGWLDSNFPFSKGATTQQFQDALRLLCHTRVYLHRGFHYCQFCPRDPGDDLMAWPTHFERMGNGQIRVMAEDGTWYAAPTLIHHYVVSHEYQPPHAFIEAVLGGQ